MSYIFISESLTAHDVNVALILIFIFIFITNGKIVQSSCRKLSWLTYCTNCVPYLHHNPSLYSDKKLVIPIRFSVVGCHPYAYVMIDR